MATRTPVTSDTFDGTGALAGNWTAQHGGCERLNDLVYSSVGADENVVYDSGTYTADQYAEGIVAAEATEVWLMLRASGTGAVLGYTVVFDINADTVTIFEHDTAPYTQIGASFSVALAATDTLAAEVVGNVIEVFVNSVSQGTRTDTGSHYSSGKPGFGVYNPESPILTSWVGGDLTGGGATATVATIRQGGRVQAQSTVAYPAQPFHAIEFVAATA